MTETENKKAASTLTLSKDPAQAAKEVLAIVDRLHAIIDKETAALEAADNAAFLALQQEKIDATQAYHQAGMQLMARKEEFAPVRDALRRKLLERETAFQASTDNNMKKLQSMGRGLKRLSGRLMENAREQAQKMRAVNYSAEGTINDGSTRAVSIGVSKSA